MYCNVLYLRTVCNGKTWFWGRNKMWAKLCRRWWVDREEGGDNVTAGDSWHTPWADRGSLPPVWQAGSCRSPGQAWGAPRTAPRSSRLGWTDTCSAPSPGLSSAAWSCSPPTQWRHSDITTPRNLTSTHIFVIITEKRRYFVENLISDNITLICLSRLPELDSSKVKVVVVYSSSRWAVAASVWRLARGKKNKILMLGIQSQDESPDQLEEKMRRTECWMVW